MTVFDKINNRVIVNAFKEVFNRRQNEIFSMNVPKVGTFH